ncbi:MAG: cupin domain-containing protein [Verrucomicrobia bacterium]|nr:cupin domain-containing protein [Verrucomicrobiota bacterium]
MSKNRQRICFTLFSTVMMATAALCAAEQDAATSGFQPVIIEKVVKEAQKNTNWKTAAVTGKSEQVVFMNVSPVTNPNNEIGVEVHPFDQVILIVQGKAKAVLDGKESAVKEGDLIFIPEGTSHNFINLGKDKELKLISFYSSTDIPAGAAYPKKSDQAND